MSEKDFASLNLSWNDVELDLVNAIQQKKSPKLIAFDVDDTIVDGNSGATFAKELYQRGFLGLSMLLKIPLYHLAYKFGILNYVNMVKMGLKSWRKIPISHIETCGERCYSELVKPKLRSGAIKLLTSLKKAGYQLVLISSSHESILKPLSRDLGIDLICTQCETKQGFYTGRLKGEPCFGEGKVRLLRQTFGDVPYIALSDSCSDLPLLKQSERAFAVTPTSALRKQAKAHAWPIILN